MKAQGVIFDMDGSLYEFDRGAAQTFEQSTFSLAIREKVIAFFQERFGIGKKEAEERFNDLSFRSNGELSLWLEQNHGILRAEYFGATWDLNPQTFMDQSEELVACLGTVAAKRAILSNAPRIWIDRVTEFLQINHLFDPTAIFSGEPDIRKPHPAAFMQVAEFWGLAPAEIIAIGDQEESDILPAQSVGMQTVRIGKNVRTKADFTAENMPAAIKLLKKEKIL